MSRSFDMPGDRLEVSDFRTLELSWITPELAKQARLRRVSSNEGSVILGRNGRGNYAGILFPYFLPGQKRAREYRIRRDHPDYEQNHHGRPREKGKYLSPPGHGNILYFVPGTPIEWLTDAAIPVAVTEGEKKALALWRLSLYDSDTPRFLPVGLPGVYGWRGTIGKTSGPSGGRCDVKGPIPDLDRIIWAKRKALILFDVNVRTNQLVAAARFMLSKELPAEGLRCSGWSCLTATV